MRNNSGALKDETGRLVRYGLGNVSKESNSEIKTSDLIGFKTVIITPEMVGKKVAIFTAVEVKREGFVPGKLDRRYNSQKNYIDFVNNNGGIAGFCDSVEEFEKLMSL